MISAAWIEGKNRSTNHGSLHWRCVVQQWSDPQTWIRIVFPKKRCTAISYIRLLMNDSTQRAHQHRIGLADTGTKVCECNQAVEDEYHFFFEVEIRHKEVITRNTNPSNLARTMLYTWPVMCILGMSTGTRVPGTRIYYPNPGS